MLSPHPEAHFGRPSNGALSLAGLLDIFAPRR
jgi:hypothetical protein